VAPAVLATPGSRPLELTSGELRSSFGRGHTPPTFISFRTALDRMESGVAQLDLGSPELLSAIFIAGVTGLMRND
jgi:hypothetical protein